MALGDELQYQYPNEFGYMRAQLDDIGRPDMAEHHRPRLMFIIDNPHGFEHRTPVLLHGLVALRSSLGSRGRLWEVHGIIDTEYSGFPMPDSLRPFVSFVATFNPHSRGGLLRPAT